MSTTALEDPMKKKTKREGIEFEAKGLLIPISLGIMALLRFMFGVPLWILAMMCVWIPLYFLGYPALVRRRWLVFEKEFALRFQRGEYKKLLDFYKDQWFLRRFGPKPEMLGKLGLIYAAMERYRDAEQAFERAIEEAAKGQRERLYFNLANVKFELGKYDDAEQIYRTLKPSSPYRHASQTHLAIIDVHQGRRLDVARTILKQERARAHGPLRARIDQALELCP